MNAYSSRDVTTTTLAVLFIAILTTASSLILLPFLPSIAWAVMIVIATWPVLLWLQSRFRGSRTLAVTVMIALILAVVVGPLLLALITIVGSSDDIALRIRALAAFRPPAPPEWVDRIPLVGRQIADTWQYLATASSEALTTLLAPHARKALGWFVTQAGSLAMIIVQFLLTVLVSAVLYAKGEAASAGVRRFARGLAGQHGEEAAVLAAKAVKGVALGIVVTALIQTTIGGVGLVVTGVPAAIFLSAVLFIFCLAQIPALLLIPVVVWHYWSQGLFWGTILLVFAVVALVVDNFIRPVLIKKGVNLSLVLIIPGVIGGLIAFGIIGLFIGPVVLAVTYTLLKAWVFYRDTPEEKARA